MMNIRILNALLVVSLTVNLVQLYIAQQERTYTQLGHNLVQSELSADAHKVELSGDCATTGALQSQPVVGGVLTCSSRHKWEPAMCNQNGMISKDDFGMILSCDGAHWRVAQK